jgi:allophanate hydrolase subunit 2
MGGLEGRALAAGDRLSIGDAPVRRGMANRSALVPAAQLVDTTKAVRVLAGPQHDRFTPDSLTILQSAPYAIGVDSSRMGYRLEGPPLRHLRGADIISDATLPGALQVPASGQPILLMADRQTTGGYPKIATVIAADIGIAAQLAPGDAISFRVCTDAEALAALIGRERTLMAIERRSS